MENLFEDHGDWAAIFQDNIIIQQFFSLLDANIELLNMKQREVFDYVYGWTKSDTKTLTAGSITQAKPKFLFMSGDTGI